MTPAWKSSLELLRVGSTLKHTQVLFFSPDPQKIKESALWLFSRRACNCDGSSCDFDLQASQCLHCLTGKSRPTFLRNVLKDLPADRKMLIVELLKETGTGSQS